ncbi:hypothetical protein [Saccharothrix sp. Mg75]|uniref:hypothetical protein n=1 Tax=Saccharothrix sp. Mg75 TaxID=3445357 RepID=UPI003EEAD0A6
MSEPQQPTTPGQQPVTPSAPAEPVEAAAERPTVEQARALPVAPVRRGRVRGFVRHRATQLVAVGLLGLVLGGGAVALLDRDGPRVRAGVDRPGHSRFDDRGDGRGGDWRGDRRGGERGERGPGRGGER